MENYSRIFGLILILCLGFVSCDVNCYYCGFRRLCPLPFDPDNCETIVCKYSCMKFDGYSSTDDSRVVVRECGPTDQNICNKTSTWFGASGVTCTCNDEACNGATIPLMSQIILSLITLTNLIVSKIWV